MDKYTRTAEIRGVRSKPNPYRAFDPPTALLLDVVRLAEMATRRVLAEHERRYHSGLGDPLGISDATAAGGASHGTA